MLFSLIFLKVDKVLPWLKCRLIFCLTPPILISAGNALLPFLNDTRATLAVLLLDSLARSTAFSGSIYTINYELDPVNAPLILGLFNTFGQLSGFLNPLTMTQMTGALDKTRPDYKEQLKYRWDTFFFINAGVEFGAVVAIVISVIVGRKEWRKFQTVVSDTKQTAEEESQPVN